MRRDPRIRCGEGRGRHGARAWRVGEGASAATAGSPSSSAGVVDKVAFVDLDAVPEEGLSLEQGLSFVLSPEARLTSTRTRTWTRIT